MLTFILSIIIPISRPLQPPFILYVFDPAMPSDDSEVGNVLIIGKSIGPHFQIEFMLTDVLISANVPIKLGIANNINAWCDTVSNRQANCPGRVVIDMRNRQLQAGRYGGNESRIIAKCNGNRSVFGFSANRKFASLVCRAKISSIISYNFANISVHVANIIAGNSCSIKTLTETRKWCWNC